MIMGADCMYYGNSASLPDTEYEDLKKAAPETTRVETQKD
jgi:hypothetical protein